MKKVSSRCFLLSELNNLKYDFCALLFILNIPVYTNNEHTKILNHIGYSKITAQ